MGDFPALQSVRFNLIFSARLILIRGLNMKNLLRLSCFLTFLLLLSTPIFAQIGPPQWTAVPMAFNGKIHIVKFLDAVGAPLTGFVGDDTGISFTTNGGTSWTRATINSPNADPFKPFQTGWVNDITFKDAMNGFAVIDSNYAMGNSSTDAGILITTNGGQSWIFDDANGTPDSGRGIYYNTANNRLYVASCDRGLVVSTDNGGTWSVQDTGTSYTGFAFNGNGLGVVATEGSSCVNFPLPYKVYWMNTTDGGMHWAKTQMNTDCWQPVGIPTTETFFGSTTVNCAGVNNAIMRSDNGGYAFSPVLGYQPANIDTLSEAMAGDACSLFASSFSQDGMWFSTNDGAKWQVIPFSPNPGVNTRFYVSPDTVWSFVGDSLKWFVRPATADIHIWPDTIAFKHASCGALSDTTIHVFGCNCPNSPELDSVKVVRLTSTVDTIKANTFNPPALPQPLCTLGLTAADSIELQFQPTGDAADSANVKLVFLDNGVLVDTFIHMNANGIVPILQVPPAPINLSGPACYGDIDTCIEIVNQSCDAITLTSATVGEQPQDMAELQLTGACILNAAPITLGPGASWCFPIDYFPGLKANTQNASFSINYVDNGVNATTNTVEVNGNTTTSVSPSFRGFNINAKSCCDVPSFTTIYFTNPTCDTIVLTNPTITGTGSYTGNFQFDTSGALGVKFPVKIPPVKGHVGLTILIDCKATDIKAIVHFPYTIISPFASVICANNVDSTLYETGVLLDTLTLDVQNPITPATVSPLSVNFGSVNCCDTTEKRTIKITAGCKPDTLTKFALSGNINGNFVFDTVGGSGLPIYLDSAQTTTIQVGFNPLCGSNGGKEPNGNIVISQTSEGVASALNIPLIADTTNAPSASLSTYAMGFDSVRSCAGQTCNTLTVTNASCGAVNLSLLTPPVNPAFTVGSVTTSTIAQGGTTTVSVCMNPSASKVTGAIQDSAVFEASANGLSSTVTLLLTAYIEPPVPSYTLTQLANLTICDSTSMTESFSVTNTGSCYTYDVVSASGGNSVSVTPPPGGYPVHIDSGASQAFSVTFAPTSVGNFSGNITLTDSDGTTIQVPYTFTDTNCTVTGQLTFKNSGNTIVTPNCLNGEMNFTVGAGGGSGVVNSVSVSPSGGRFEPTNPISGSMPFTDTILFDPNPSGSSSALVTINYTINGVAGVDTFSVYGQTTGTVGTASIGVTTPSDSCISPNDTALKEFDVMLYDDIPNSLGVTQLTFVISYNGNLLWNPKNINFGPGWTFVSDSQANDGLHITLSYDSTGSANGSTSGEALIKITQLGAITTLLSDTAVITSPHFNDSAFEACTLKALAAGGANNSAPICIDTTCGWQALQMTVAGNLQPITGIQVVPNPAHKGGSASTLHFTTNIAGNVNADVLDELGHSVLMLTNGALETGDHALAIPTDQIPEGAYFARITVNGITVIRQFVLVKE